MTTEPTLATDGPPVWQIGRNLPWVAPWTGEDEFTVKPSEIFPGFVELVQAERPGVGTPMLSGMNVMRQRLGVMEHRCHVCGAVAPAGDRYLFPVVTGTFLKMKGGARYVSHLPPTHRRCAERAQRLCPHLRSTYAQPVAFPRDEGFLGPERSIPENLKRLAGQLPQGAPVAFSYYRVFGAAFTRVVQRLRREASAG